ncbi:hypothetical protein [Sinorhizobium sp. M4_45]|uniref:hypothetical protein n=1 Tax=Sinorhizobium sp. M4_45 TaxID=2037901 RepID=UPI000C9AFE0B|nr:hypothetical protein [Sinorhizobium sp. M4_45]PND27627.1 hypothetical protein CN933_05735 [Sinorhizobium sp. M4_45]
MAGEGEEEGQGQEPASPEVERTTEATTIGDDVRIEVDILALTAARKITGTIADQVAKLSPDIVLVGGEGVAATARAFIAFRERANRVISDLEKLQAEPKLAETKPTEEGPVLGAFELVKGVASLMSYFKAETNYYGRKVELTEAALYPLLASHMSAKSIPIVLPEHFAQQSEKTVPEFSVFHTLDKLIDGRNRVSELYQGAPPAGAAALLATADAIIDSAVKPDPQTGNIAVNQLVLGSDLCRLAADAATPLLVSMKCISSGGHVRTRKHLFTTIFTGDKLSFSGGVAVGYFIIDLKTFRVLGGDVVAAVETMKGS